MLSHYVDNHYRPIAFASCALTPAQKNCSSLDEEAFSIVFGVKRFHQYLSGRKLSLFAPGRPVTVHVAARLQRWSLVLPS